MTYIALLRGINVGGHHKVPMADLKAEMTQLGFSNIITILNSGNVLFDGAKESLSKLEDRIAKHLEGVFGFPIPILIRTRAEWESLVSADPFKEIEVTKETRLYLTFLKAKSKIELELPWVSEDNSFRIIEIQDKTICSVLDLNKGKTVKGMDALEKMFGKGLTTRNWKTVMRIQNKLK